MTFMIDEYMGSSKVKVTRSGRYHIGSLVQYSFR